MKIKRYNDIDRRRVMDRVRSEMGADATILSSRLTEEGFSLVACDLDEQLLDQQVIAGKERSLSLVVDEPQEPAPQQDAKLDSLQEELNKLRSFIEVELPQLANRNVAAAKAVSSSADSLVARLQRLGFSQVFSKTLQAQVGEVTDLQQAWKKSLRVVERRLSEHPDSGFRLRGHYALMGPAASGKTATLCKIAARCQRCLGPDAIGIISVDRKRFGAHQQIGQFAKFMKLPVVKVSDWRDLRKAAETFSDKELVLIDTPSLKQGDDLSHYLRGLKETGQPVQGLYCFAATSSGELLLDHARIAKSCGVSAVVTRVDECLSLASVLEAMARTSLPLFYLCDGSSIRNGIKVLASKELCRISLEKYRESRELARQPAARRELSA